MKKITMLFVLSVFFFIGGMTNSFAQKITNESKGQVDFSPLALLVSQGETVTMEFSLFGDVSDGQPLIISLLFQRPGEKPIVLISIDQNGKIIYKNPGVTRITVYYNVFNRTGIITISNIQPEDAGDYFVAAGRYFSNGVGLLVRRPD